VRQQSPASSGGRRHRGKSLPAPPKKAPIWSAIVEAGDLACAGRHRSVRRRSARGRRQRYLVQSCGVKGYTQGVEPASCPCSCSQVLVIWLKLQLPRCGLKRSFIVKEKGRRGPRYAIPYAETCAWRWTLGRGTRRVLASRSLDSWLRAVNCFDNTTKRASAGTGRTTRRRHCSASEEARCGRSCKGSEPRRR
jgi:hypothetical protein